jgi:hypothetical protein
LIFLLALSFGLVRAQQASVAVSPASIDAKVKGGMSYTQNFIITNNTGSALKFRLSVNDLWYDEQNKRVTGRPGTLPRSASLWIQFTPAEVVIKANGSAVVKAVITVPKGATGSFYSVPVFEGLPVEIPDKSANNSTASIGVRFLGLMQFTTEEGAEYNVEIMDGKISPPLASSMMELSLNLRNRGSAHAKVRGTFAILNAAGVLAGRGNIEEKKYMPGQRNLIKSKWAGDLKPGKYVCLVTLSYNRVSLEPASMSYEIPFEVK